MGSDRKSKRAAYSSPSDSEDEKRSKRKRTVDDDEKKNRKREKKEKRKDKKHSKEKSDKGKKSKDKHRSKRSNVEFKELSNEDYFAKNNEFATWLKEEKNVFFSDLITESAREMFADFVKAWNRGKLESHYYEGIATGPRTSHNWKIKK